MFRFVLFLLTLGLVICDEIIAEKEDSATPGTDAEEYTGFLDGTTETTEQVTSTIVDSGSGSGRKTRVIGGMEVNPHDYPSIVSLHYNSDIVGCGGTTISSRLVLTAAHCLQKSCPSHIHISLPDGSDMSLSTISCMPHEDYQNETDIHDIGVVVLKDHIPNFEKIKRARLVPEGWTLGGRRMVGLAFGRGRIVEAYRSDGKLRAVGLRILPEYECKKQTDDSGHLFCIDSVKNDGKSKKIVNVCSGDSGGPLMWNSREGSFQIGIVSYVREGCASGLPAMFTDISHYRSWIKKQYLDIQKIEPFLQKWKGDMLIPSLIRLVILMTP